MQAHFECENSVLVLIGVVSLSRNSPPKEAPKLLKKFMVAPLIDGLKCV